MILTGSQHLRAPFSISILASVTSASKPLLVYSRQVRSGKDNTQLSVTEQFGDGEPFEGSPQTAVFLRCIKKNHRILKYKKILYIYHLAVMCGDNIRVYTLRTFNIPLVYVF